MTLKRRDVVAALAAATVIGVRRAFAARRQRVTQKVAQYQAKPKGIQSCANCAQFVAPSRCKTVFGKVSAHGWCMLYEMVD